MKKRELKVVISNLLAVSEQAIHRGDWQADGACDPGLAISLAREALGVDPYGGAYWNPASAPWEGA